jgi:phosphatidylglycerophosphate synthase
MITPKEIAKKTMTPQKKKGAKYDIFAFYIGRPISYVLTVPFIELGIRPNVISLISFIPSFAGFFLLGFGTTKTLRILGTLCFLLWNFMDGIDGNTARYTGQQSKMGRLWDATSGYIATVLLYFSMGISVMSTPMPQYSFGSLLNMPSYYYLVLGGLTSINMMLYRLVMHKKMLLYTEEAGQGLNDKNTYSGIKIIALNLTSTAGLMQVFMIIAVATNYTREFVIFFFLIQFAVTIWTLRQMLSLQSDEFLE